MEHRIWVTEHSCSNENHDFSTYAGMGLLWETGMKKDWFLKFCCEFLLPFIAVEARQQAPDSYRNLMTNFRPDPIADAIWEFGKKNRELFESVDIRKELVLADSFKSVDQSRKKGDVTLTSSPT
jgi:hypothetical protein